MRPKPGRCVFVRISGRGIIDLRKGRVASASRFARRANLTGGRFGTRRCGRNRPLLRPIWVVPPAAHRRVITACPAERVAFLRHVDATRFRTGTAIDGRDAEPFTSPGVKRSPPDGVKRGGICLCNTSVEAAVVKHCSSKSGHWCASVRRFLPNGRKNRWFAGTRDGGNSDAARFGRAARPHRPQ